MSGQSVQRSRRCNIRLSSRWRTTSVPTVVRRGRSIMTDSIPQPEDVSPENLNEDVPRAAEEVPPEEAPEDTTEEAAEDTPEEAAEDTPEEAAEDTPEEAPEDTPEEAAEDTPEEAPEEVPEEAAEDTPKEAAEDTPEEAAEDTPEEAAEDTPEEAPEDTPEDTPEEAPEEAPEEGGQDQSVDEGEQHLCGEDSFDPGFQYEGEGSLLLDGPENQDDTSHEETEESSAFPGDEGALNEQEYEELLEQLLEQRDEALNHSSQLQAKLPQYIKRNSRNFGGLDSDVSSAEQLQMYQQNMKMLRDLKEQLVLEAQQAQEQIKELASRCQEKKNEGSSEGRGRVERKGQMFPLVCLNLSPIVLRWTGNGERSWPRRRRQRCQSSAAASGSKRLGPKWTPSWRRSSSIRRSWLSSASRTSGSTSRSADWRQRCGTGKRIGTPCRSSLSSCRPKGWSRRDKLRRTRKDL
ncbi:coiled-coil domain-containing protein 96 isoform X6 [Takifugu flavidus]|uniref:coiled-coil domain-containing protein 96 isoform X6 n=1 Tax=Takifugu flavidus TaxID=433684 RepID=UPI002544C434|nr:coiled-coil domain-containing protein 96 isoform X6 [Takifugu flavidus]